MARVLVGTDPFTAYTASAFPTSNWTDNDAGFSGSLSINAANTAISSTHSNLGCMSRNAAGETYTADQYSKLKILGIGAQSNDRIGVACRISGTGSSELGYFAYLDDNATRTTRLMRVFTPNQTGTALGTDTSVTWASGDTISMEVTGSGAIVNITVFHNDVAIPSLTNIQDNSGSRLTSGGVGVVAGISTTTLSGSPWEGGNVTNPIVIAWVV